MTKTTVEKVQAQRGRPWNVGTRGEEEVEEVGLENEENEGNLRRNGGQNTEREDEKVLWKRGD